MIFFFPVVGGAKSWKITEGYKKFITECVYLKVKCTGVKKFESGQEVTEDAPV
jgi:hypothetical protein